MHATWIRPIVVSHNQETKNNKTPRRCQDTFFFILCWFLFFFIRPCFTFVFVWIFWSIFRWADMIVFSFSNTAVSKRHAALMFHVWVLFPPPFLFSATSFLTSLCVPCVLFFCPYCSSLCSWQWYHLQNVGDAEYWNALRFTLAPGCMSSILFALWDLLKSLESF